MLLYVIILFIRKYAHTWTLAIQINLTWVKNYSVANQGTHEIRAHLNTSLNGVQNSNGWTIWNLVYEQLVQTNLTRVTPLSFAFPYLDPTAKYKSYQQQHLYARPACHTIRRVHNYHTRKYCASCLCVWSLDIFRQVLRCH